MRIDIDVPDGKSGDWAVDTFEISAELRPELCRYLSFHSHIEADA